MMRTKRRIAEFLLQSKAIKLEPASPFTWASGWKSPIYCDNRKTLSYPGIRTSVRDAYVACIHSCFELPDVIAGVATGAIAQGALVAEALGLPFIYVRSSAKGHGMQNLIEGEYSPESNRHRGPDLDRRKFNHGRGGSSRRRLYCHRYGGNLYLRIQDLRGTIFRTRPGGQNPDRLRHHA
jgi:hypothetical protein